MRAKHYWREVRRLATHLRAAPGRAGMHGSTGADPVRRAIADHPYVATRTENIFVLANTRNAPGLRAARRETGFLAKTVELRQASAALAMEADVREELARMDRRLQKGTRR